MDGLEETQYIISSKVIIMMINMMKIICSKVKPDDYENSKLKRVAIVDGVIYIKYEHLLNFILFLHVFLF